MSVYFVRSAHGGPIKIGAARNVGERLRSLRAEYEDESLHVLALLHGYIDEEKALHRRFAHLRRSGEWFAAESELWEFIADKGKPWDEEDLRHRPGHTVRISDTALERAKVAARDNGESVVAYISRIVADTALKDVERAMEMREAESRRWIAEQKRLEAG